MKGIKFIGKHSYDDFDLTIAPGKEIGIPEKQKIIIKVPFSNVDYDFSEVYGSQVYTNRAITYPFNIYNQYHQTKESMNIRKTQVINWLMNSGGKQKLYDDAMPGYYFLAEVQSSNSFSEEYEAGILNVTFDAYPFMISELEEGNDIWDTFNFELDVSQQVKFDIEGQLEITLYNVGTPNVTPTITASSEMTIETETNTYNVPSGESKNSDFYLASGETDLIITGNGTIKFTFYKELI